MLADGVEPSRANSVVGQVEAPLITQDSPGSTPMTAASALVGSHLPTTGFINESRSKRLM
jgi:hypothetical protein